MRILEGAFDAEALNGGWTCTAIPSISCKELTRPGNRGGEVKDLGRVSSDAAALAFPLVVGDSAGDAVG